MLEPQKDILNTQVLYGKFIMRLCMQSKRHETCERHQKSS